MTYPYPGDISVIAQLLIDKIDGNKENFVIPVLGVFYGDQDRVGNTPVVCIEPNEKRRELQGVPDMTRNEFEILILVYITRVQSTVVSRKESDQLAYDIEKYIHQDLQLKNGGATPNVIHGYIRSNESGYALKANTLYRAARLTYYGLSKTSLPVA